MDFQFIETEKLGGNWSQQFVIVREKSVYLRVVGDGANYRVMTATASEETGGYHICQDKERLLETASRLARTFSCTEHNSKDGKGREYIQLFTMSQEEDETDEVFTKHFEEMVGEFFIIYDGLAI